MPTLTQSVTVPQPPAGTGPFASSYTFIQSGRTNAQSGAVHTIPWVTSTPGDLLVVTLNTTSGTITAPSVGAPGTTGWQDTGNGIFHPNAESLLQYMGTVTAAQSTTITFNYTGAPSVSQIEVSEYGCAGQTASTIWAVDKFGTAFAVSGTSFNMPTLTPTATTPELYVGTDATGSTASGGGTAGFTYFGTGSNFCFDCYNLAVAGAVTPVMSQAGSSGFLGIAALFNAKIPTTSQGPAQVFLPTVPTGRQWVISQIGYEFLPATILTNITATVYMNNRVISPTVDPTKGIGFQGPPYFTVHSGDTMYIQFQNAPVGTSAIVNFQYNEYSAFAQPHDLGGLV